MKLLKKALDFFIHPGHNLIIIFAFSLIISLLSLLITLTIPYLLLRIVTGILFVITAIYVTYLIIRYLRVQIKEVLGRLPLLRYVVYDYRIRTVVFALLTTLYDISYGLFNFIFGLVNEQYWTIQIGFYYISLCFIRGFVSVYGTRLILKAGNNYARRGAEIAIFKECAILLLFLEAPLALAVTALFIQPKVEESLIIALAFAIYTITKLVLAVFNVFKARKTSNMYVMSLRNINLTDAIVSLFSLEAVMMVTFGDISIISSSKLTLITGVFLMLFTFILPITMLVRTHKETKNLRTEYFSRI